MGNVAARQHPVARIGTRVGASLVLIGLAMLVAAYVLPFMEPIDPRVGQVLTILGRPFIAAGAMAAVVAALLDRLVPIPGGAVREAVEREETPSQAADLSAAPEVIRDIVAAARQRGYQVGTVAPGSGAVVVRMTSPLEPGDRQLLIRQFPTLGRWYFSGSAQAPPDEGFCDAESGAAISFPVQIASHEH